MLSAFFVLAETTGDVADPRQAKAHARGNRLRALGARLGLGHNIG